MNELAARISALPEGSWIPIAGLVLLGACLWAAGRRLLRTGFAGLGLLVGAGAGWIAGESVALGVPSWATAVFGGLLFALIATMAYRAAVAVGLALVLAAVAGLATWSSGTSAPSFADAPRQADDGVQDEDAAATELSDQLDEWLARIRTTVEGEALDDAEVEGPPSPPSPLDDHLHTHLAHAEVVALGIVDALRAQWDALPGELRQRMLAAIVVAAVLGFLLGTVACGLSASLVTACGGGLVLLVGVWAAACKLGAGDAQWMPAGPQPWLTSWMLLSVIGLLIQWTGRPRRADKAGAD